MRFPDVIPIFPLPNVILFPGVPLPLHIFEPRYRDMVRDTLQHDPAVIGMVLLRGDWREAYAGKPDVFAVGCAGQMVQHESLDDGRSNILLQGMREFSVVEEVGDTSYRQARVAWREPMSGKLVADKRQALESTIERFLRTQDQRLTDRLVNGEMVDELFVNFASYALDLPPLEKLSLLEIGDIGGRAERLRVLIEFALSSGPQGADDLVH